MKLIHLNSGFVVAEILQRKIIIHDRMLEKEMRIRGIAIPPPLRAAYGGKVAVRLEDPEFEKAFKEAYFPMAFNPQSYSWEK